MLLRPWSRTWRSSCKYYDVNCTLLTSTTTCSSTIAAANTPNQVYLAEALVGSPVFKTFIPSDFGCVWNEEEISTPGLSFLKIKEEAAENIKHLKVPITEIKVGMFDLFFFGYK